MSDTDRVEELSSSPLPAGERLRAAREAQGLSLTSIAERTRVPLRHLESIEAGDYESLPAPAYATGFSRAYARAVGVDEVAIARDVRAEAAKLGRRQPEYAPYVTADPARLPSRGLAMVTAGIALAIIVLAALWFGTGWLRGRGGETSPAPAVAPTTAAPVAAPPAPASAPPRRVTLTANDTIWLRVYDAANKTLFLGTMKPGDTFDVPPGADHPKINVGRADKLAVTLDGKPVAALGTGERPIKDVPVDAASIAARAGGSGVATPVPTPTPQPTAAPTAAGTRATSHHGTRHSAGDETQRANRSSARAAEKGEAPPVPTPAAAPSTSSETPHP
ncbi:helix-turn-helix domain-containing protein [uncultured Sphingomonas sp.]|uniref:helix-turn-helix domain-containing protein n=1 Tax=uncultured Sphingomonas sp. TaxID=158754 RepID=UPI0035CA7E87